MELQTLGLFFSFITNYKKVDWLRLGTVIMIDLRTSSKKLTTSVAARPFIFLRRLRVILMKNSPKITRNKSEVVHVLFNVAKLSGMVIEELAVLSFD